MIQSKVYNNLIFHVTRCCKNGGKRWMFPLFMGVCWRVSAHFPANASLRQFLRHVFRVFRASFLHKGVIKDQVHNFELQDLHQELKSYFNLYHITGFLLNWPYTGVYCFKQFPKPNFTSRRSGPNSHCDINTPTASSIESVLQHIHLSHKP